MRTSQQCRCHPLAVRHEAPHNKRIQQTIPSANKFASGLAPDPQPVGQRKIDKYDNSHSKKQEETYEKNVDDVYRHHLAYGMC